MTPLERLLAGSHGWRIADPALLAALLGAVAAVAVLGAAGALRRRAQLRRSFGALAPVVAPQSSLSRTSARLALLCSGTALLAVAAARPQSGARTAEVRVTGVDLAVVLDASRSMLAGDARPTRLDAARASIAALLDRRPGDRVAIVAFAASALVQCPLTVDHRAAKLLLGAVDPAAMPRQGTDLGAGLDAALRAFDDAEDVGSPRVVLLVTDGEDHGGRAAEAADALALRGVQLLTAGAGSSEGARIPSREPGGFVTEDGRAVVSRLDEDALADLAARAGGRYVGLSGGGAAVDALATALGRVERDSTRTVRFSSWDDRFEWFAVPALLLLLASSVLPERRRARSARPRSPRAAAATALLLVSAAPFLAEHEGLAAANALAARDPAAALPLFEDVEREVGPRPEIDVDRGIALFRAGRVEEARRAFALVRRAPGPLASRAAFAEGIAALSAADGDAAIGALRRAVVLDPANGAARHDLEVLLRRRAEQRRQPPRSAAAEEPQPGGDGGAPQPRGARAEAGHGRDASRPEPAVQGERRSAMSRGEAERLLDQAAAHERVWRAGAPRGPQPATARPW